MTRADLQELKRRADSWLSSGAVDPGVRTAVAGYLIHDLLSALTEAEAASAAYRQALEKIVGRAGDTVLPSVPYSREDCQEIARKALRALDGYGLCPKCNAKLEGCAGATFDTWPAAYPVRCPGCDWTGHRETEA